MIEEWLVSRLDAVEELGQRVYPVAVCVDDVSAPMAIYRQRPGEAVRDLSGEIHHRADNWHIVLLGKDYAQLCRIESAVWESIEENSNLDTGYGAYLFSAECYIPEDDGFSLDTQLISKTVGCTLRWCGTGE